MHSPPTLNFDAASVSYDRDFTATHLGRLVRVLVWEQIAAIFQPGERVLELGCGTGEDALWLARRGVQVLATDQSQGMLAVATAKAQAAGYGQRIDTAMLDLSDLQLAAPVSSFDGVFSNFGALNCVADRHAVASFLARMLRPGGRVVAVLISPTCPWEIGWHALRGQWRVATRRWRGGELAHAGNGSQVRVWYPTPTQLADEFSGSFRLVDLVGIGVLLPPSYLERLVARAPQFWTTMALCERHLARLAPWTWMNDHYLAVFERL
ncbi:MAG: class I SAM-dependent methyltransferase [Roseiflexaceae bacterium]